MLHSFLFAPFSDLARQEQFEAVQQALHAEDSLPTTLLLGNLAALDAPPADALLVQAGRLVLLTLVPQRGHLRIPALEYGTWRLNDQPLPSFGAADNPFAFYCQQKDALTQWLGAQLGLAPTDLPLPVGMVVFVAPVSYGPEVESQLSRQAAVHNFQLVSDARQLPRRVGQLEPSGGVPTASAIASWATQLEAEYWADEPASTEEQSYGFWEQQARRLWLWLGAADVPTDPPYSSASDPQQLEAFRRELQTELKQQQQAAQARETAREQELIQLRQQLAQTPAQQHLAQQERAELEEALRIARAESATRNQELDARIQQLGQLIEQLRTQTIQAPTPTAVKPASVAPPMKSPPPRPVRKPIAATPAVHLRLTRVALLVGVLLCVGLGGWGLVRLSKNYLAGRKPKREQTARAPQSTDNYSTDTYAESALPLADSVADVAGEPNSDGSLIVHDEPLIMQEESLIVHHPKLIMQVTSDSAAKAVEQEEVTEPDSTTP